MNGHLSTLVHGGVAHHCHEVEAGPWPPTPGGTPAARPSLGLEQQRDRNIAPTRSSLEVSAPREVR